MTDQQRIEEIAARTKTATAGPWQYDGDSCIRAHVIGIVHDERMRFCDGRFIAHAREDIPWLLDQLDQRDAEIKRLKESLHED